MRIHRLPPQLANQIAAGEVIERPASVVKELLENSLDAGTTEVMIDIVGGGSTLIRVADNGHGIYQADLALALARHGTSKITHVDDLARISTLGFRGEALASIGAVSRLKLSSRPHDQDVAWQVMCEGLLQEANSQPVAHPQGTTVEVYDLFFNTPVRRRFLRSEKTETLHIEEVVRRIALSRFDLRILFTHNQKKVWLLPAAHQEIAKEGRIARLIHKNFMDQAVKLDYQISTLRLWGWLTLGRLIQPKLNAQYLYINGRFVRDRIITHALREACASVGGISDHMAYILFLELNPDAVDVNVHPTKHEVRFQESRIIHDFIYRAIKQALVSPVASTDPLSPLDGHPMGITVDLPEPVMALPLTPSPPRLPQVLSSSFMQRYIAPNQHLITEAVLAAPTKEEARVWLDQAPLIAPSTLPARRPLGVIHQRFFLAETPEGLMLVDLLAVVHQHLTLQLLASTTATITTRPLLIPVTTVLAKRDESRVTVYLEAFTRLGMDVALLSESTTESVWVLRSIPDVFADVSVPAFFTDLLAALVGSMDPLPLEGLIDCIAQAAALRLKSWDGAIACAEAMLDQPQFSQTYREFSLAELERWIRG